LQTCCELELLHEALFFRVFRFVAFWGHGQLYSTCLSMNTAIYLRTHQISTPVTADEQNSPLRAVQGCSADQPVRWIVEQSFCRVLEVLVAGRLRAGEILR